MNEFAFQGPNQLLRNLHSTRCQGFLILRLLSYIVIPSAGVILALRWRAEWIAQDCKEYRLLENSNFLVEV